MENGISRGFSLANAPSDYLFEICHAKKQFYHQCASALYYSVHTPYSSIICIVSACFVHTFSDLFFLAFSPTSSGRFHIVKQVVKFNNSIFLSFFFDLFFFFTKAKFLMFFIRCYNKFDCSRSSVK